MLHAHRREIGTRAGRRTGTARTQATLVLRWFRDDAPIRLLALEAQLPISTCYRYLHEAIDVIAEQAPDLHNVLDRAKREQWSYLTLDGTLIETDRVNERAEAGHHLWYSGKHKTQGGNVQILADPGGFPVWSSEVEPGSVHDITRRPRALSGRVVQGSRRWSADADGQGIRGRRDRGAQPGQGPRPRCRQSQLQHAADRDPGNRGTRQCRTQRTLAVSPANQTVPKQNWPDCCRRNRPINSPEGELLRKPQWRVVTRPEGPRSMTSRSRWG